MYDPHDPMLKHRLWPSLGGSWPVNPSRRRPPPADILVSTGIEEVDKPWLGKPFYPAWYEQHPERVSEERQKLRTLGLAPEFYQDSRDNLVLVFERPHGRIEVRTDRDHPYRRPQLMVQGREDLAPRPVEGFAWDESYYIFEIVAPLIGA